MRLADNRIRLRDAGVEALARALPPSLTTLELGGMCGVGLVAAALSVGACAAVRGRRWCAVLGADLVVADRLGRGPSARIGGLGLVIEGRLACVLQGTESELRVWRRWRAHCRRV